MIEMFTPIDELAPFFQTEVSCASEEEAYILAEQNLMTLTGQAVHDVGTSQ